MIQFTYRLNEKQTVTFIKKWVLNTEIGVASLSELLRLVIGMAVAM